MPQNKDFFNKALAALSRHGPDPVLALVLFVAFLWALKSGLDPLYSLIGLALVWFGYHVRRVAAERHLERMAEQEIYRIEKSQGAEIKRAYRSRAKASPTQGVKP